MSAFDSTTAFSLPQTSIMAQSQSADAFQDKQPFSTYKIGDISQHPQTTIVAKNSSVNVKKATQNLPMVIMCTFVVSIFFALLGLLSLCIYFVRNVYIIHPYVALISFIGGSFLFSSSYLAVKGK